MIRKVLVTLISTLAAVAAFFTIIAVKGIEREKRNEATKLSLIPALLPSAFPPLGGCYEVLDEGTMYLYHENGERKASRVKPDGLKCSKKDNPSSDNSNATPEEISIAELNDFAERANMQLPHMLDDQTRADSVDIDPASRIITNNITLVKLDYGGQSNKELGKILEKEVRPKLCRNEMFSKLRARGATIAFNYHNNQGSSVYTLIIKPSDCELQDDNITVRSEAAPLQTNRNKVTEQTGNPTCRHFTYTADKTKADMYSCVYPDGSRNYASELPDNAVVEPLMEAP